jgi:hypothetical protein
MEQNTDGYSRWIKPTDPTPHPITLFLKLLYFLKLATWKDVQLFALTVTGERIINMTDDEFMSLWKQTRNNSRSP